MSLILVGIDIPKDKKIDIEISPTGLVWVDKGEEYYCLEDLAIQIPTPHGRLGDIDELSRRMYHQAFETDTIFQRWDGGCWIRYKMFENCRDVTPTILEGEYE